MSNYRKTSVLFALIACVAMAHSAWADNHKREKRPRNTEQPRADRAIDEARQSTGGRVLKVRPGDADSGSYRVKILMPDGTVKTITVAPD